MKIENKTIDYNKNICKCCSKEISRDDIIIKVSLFCHNCYNEITQININDVEYIYYKERVKSWLISKYNFNI